jgi:hypothetical protein
MNNPILHQALITAGSVLWAVACAWEARQPQLASTACLLAAPLLLLAGIALWARHYRRTKGRWPSVGSIADNVSYTGGKASLNTDYLLGHLGEFWAGCMLFWMCIVMAGSLPFRSSDAFMAAQQHCESHPGVLRQVGEIRYYGLLMSGRLLPGAASLSFSIVGTKGSVGVQSELRLVGGAWTVDTLLLR